MRSVSFVSGKRLTLSAYVEYGRRLVQKLDILLNNLLNMDMFLTQTHQKVFINPPEPCGVRL